MSNSTSSAFRKFPVQTGKVGETIVNPTVEEFLKEIKEPEVPTNEEKTIEEKE